SFAWIARREPRPTAPRLQRILDELSERLQAPRLLPEHLIASRGNVAVVQTTRTQGHGGWTLHVPLCRHKSRLVVRHFDWLQRLRTEHPNVPVPEPLYAGTCQGLYLSVEERLPGHHAPQLSDGSLAQQRMLRDVARSLPQLAHGPRRILDADELERLLGDRIRRVLRLCGRSDTARRIQRMWDQAHEALLGHTYQPVVYHADLRPKHVQVDHEGSLQGFMDWGACEAHFLPYVDLLHLVAHRRSESARLQWERWQTGGLEAWEAEVLAEYRQTMQLDPQVAQALESLYPVLVAGMAERNWEFSRPYWVHKVFGL
ncbi:MAG TPA: aminoglycoside phosphotransferase family protein, partial [Planctomycetota bacterium]|nr:aminoglycoside phosphotransferase family protein [Planctomycetota bacterium]